MLVTSKEAVFVLHLARGFYQVVKNQATSYHIELAHMNGGQSPQEDLTSSKAPRIMSLSIHILKIRDNSIGR
jgi:ABC-type transport system involved in cytochrome bd biosynthesis fused ATPase/permease subunit